jgi:hypothetical protein
LGFVTKNDYGEYVVKERVNISGHLWIGKTLIPRLIFYAFFFIGILAIETLVVVLPLFQNGETPSLYLFYLMAPTAIATVLFLSEGLWLRKKTQHDNSKKKQSD